MNRVVISLLALVISGLTMIPSESCLADEDAFHQHREQFDADLLNGDFSSAIANAQWICKYLESVEHEPRRKYFSQWVADLERVMSFSPEVREEIAKGQRLADVESKSWARVDRQASLEELEKAYEIFSKHLPANSVIRISGASSLAFYSRRYRSTVDASISVDIPMYHQQALKSYGPDSYSTIALAMEWALGEIVGENPERGHKNMRELMFREDEATMLASHPARLAFAADYILSLNQTRRHQWLQDDAKQTLLILSPYMHEESIQVTFLDASSIILTSFELSERWLEASEVCRFVLDHEETQAPKHRDKRLHFLEHRAQALRKLGEHDEADQVAAQITEVKLRDPRNRNRYTED